MMPQQAICAGPNFGWHFNESTQEWVCYMHGRPIERVALEAWEEYKAWRYRR